MNKKLAGFIVAGVAVFALSGCGSSGGNDVVIVDPGPSPDETYLFMVDNDGFAVADVYYTCVDSFGDFIGDFYTRADGGFLFEPGENCTFDLIGYNGTPGDELHIEDIAQNPKEGIPYTCLGGDFGRTFGDGSFDYMIDDSCTFEF